MNTIFRRKKEAFTAFWKEGSTVVVNAAVTGEGFEEGLNALPGRLYYETESYLTDLSNRYAKLSLRGDSLPMVDTDLGPGSLAVYLGSEPVCEETTIWFKELGVSLPELNIPDEFPSAWWRRTLELLQWAADRVGEDYIIPTPDIVENWDTLASLIGAQNLLVWMIEEPELVKKAIESINRMWFKAFDAIYDIISPVNGGGAFNAFHLWAPGRVAKLQCDGSAMFSNEMFNEFVLPSLTEQIDWLDYSLYHLDGTQAVHHLDSLLRMKNLDVIEWTPQAGIETGIDPRWYPMFRKILESGKKLQVLVTDIKHIETFCREIGVHNIFFLSSLPDNEFIQVVETVEKYR